MAPDYASSLNRQILIVEDDKVTMRVTQLYLKKEFGNSAQVHHSTTLADALEKVDATAFDAILLDLNLPDSSGLDTLETMVEATSEAAIIVLTGSQDDRLGLEAVKLGAQDFLPKDSINAPALERAILFAIERSEMMQMLSRLAVKDTLCNTFNRRGFMESAKNLLEQSSDETEHFLACFDLNRFKETNDQFGHAAGDHMLQVFADSLRRNSFSEIIIGRMGGDEFVAIGPISANNDPESFLKRLIKTTDERTDDPDLVAPIRFSAGYVTFTTMQANELSLKKLLERTDKILYSAKRELKTSDDDKRYNWSGCPVDQSVSDVTNGEPEEKEAAASWPAGKALMEICRWTDAELQEHQQRVGDLAAEIAKAMKLDPRLCTAIQWAGYLHDIGKLSISPKLWAIPRKFTEQEFTEAKKHAEAGEGILNTAQPPWRETLSLVARHHHECWNGGGYPDQLTGEKIPLAARIVSVADTYDAMISSRPYKSALSPEAAREIVSELAGSRYDPEVVKTFLSLDYYLIVNQAKQSM